MIFNCTVLEVYWELEARTGTRMKLCFSTFTSFRWFSNTKTLLFVILKTMSRLLRKNKHFQLVMNWSRVKMLKIIDNYQMPQIHFSVCTLKNRSPQRHQFWSDYFKSTKIKNISLGWHCLRPELAGSGKRTSYTSHRCTGTVEFIDGEDIYQVQ